jgi:hypothetical protein
MKNLAASKGANDALVMTMNTKLNSAIDAEFGQDDGADARCRRHQLGDRSVDL